MNSGFLKLPAKFIDDRIFLCPVTENGDCLDIYTDTGGGSMFIDSELSRKLNLPIIRREIENDKEFLFTVFPNFKTNATIPSGSQNNELLIRSDLHWGQIFLGQNWFADRVWLFDYLNREMGYSLKNSHYDTNGFLSAPIGFQKDYSGSRKYSFPRIQAKIDGEVFDLLFDTGATVFLSNNAQIYFNDGQPSIRGTSFITRSVFEKWKSRHPEWIVIEGGDEYFKEDLIQVPNLEVAGFEIGPVWFTRRADPNFHEYMSQVMDKQIEGALGGSVFKYFSIIIDYPNSIAYFKR